MFIRTEIVLVDRIIADFGHIYVSFNYYVICCGRKWLLYDWCLEAPH